MKWIGISGTNFGEAVCKVRLAGKKVIALVDEEFEDLELWYPVYRVREEGAEVHLAGAEKGKTYTGKYAVPAKADYAFDELDSKDYDGILVPGGWAPDKLRRYPKVIQLVQEMHRDRKAIGQICHAGWVLISAKILNGVTVTSTPGIRDDMRTLALYGRMKPWSATDISSPPDVRPTSRHTAAHSAICCRKCQIEMIQAFIRKDLKLHLIRS
jgi:protease I